MEKVTSKKILNSSGHRSDACDFSAFAVNPNELLRELVKRHVINAVAAHIAGDAAHIVGAVSRHFDAIGHAFFACTHSEAGWRVLQIGGRAETPARGFAGGRWNHRKRAVLVCGTTKLALDASEVSFKTAAAVTAE